MNHFQNILNVRNKLTMETNKIIQREIECERNTCRQKRNVMDSSVENKSEVTFRAEEDMKVLIIAGKPLREDDVASGPFVMNSEEQIKQAYEDLRAGKFGKRVELTAS